MDERGARGLARRRLRRGRAVTGLPAVDFAAPVAAELPVPSEAIVPQRVEAEGPVRVILGRFGRAVSRIHGAPADINYFHVRLKDGQRWCYIAPTGHNVTWLAVDRGGLQLQEGERVYWSRSPCSVTSAA